MLTCSWAPLVLLIAVTFWQSIVPFRPDASFCEKLKSQPGFRPDR
jgi:hypothetical protein